MNAISARSERVLAILVKLFHAFPCREQKEALLAYTQLIRDPASRPALERAERVLAVAEYPQARAWRDAAGFRWEAAPPVVALTSGLVSPLVVWLKNDLDRTASVAIHGEGGRESFDSAKVIPAGESLPFLIGLNPGSPGATSSFIELFSGDEAGVRSRLPLPCVISAPARVTLVTGGPAKATVLSGGRWHHSESLGQHETLSLKPVIGLPAWFKVPFSYVDGQAEYLLPPGRATVTVSRGFEWSPQTQTLTLDAGGEHLLTLAPQTRWNLAAEGWISGDTHIHWAKNSWNENEDLALLPLVQQAEDVKVLNNLLLYHWLADGPFIKPDQKPMGPVPEYSGQGYHLQTGEEFRNDRLYGHLNFLNVTEVVEPISTGSLVGGTDASIDWPLNSDAIERCHAQGGLVCEAHGLGPFEIGTIPADVVLGKADVLDQLDPSYYYQFLDCGLHLPLGNGSDHPARTVASCRTYVKIEAPATADTLYPQWIAGLRRRNMARTESPSAAMLLTWHPKRWSPFRCTLARNGRWAWCSWLPMVALCCGSGNSRKPRRASRWRW